VLDFGALQIVLSALTGWLDPRERAAVACLIEENGLVRRQLGGVIRKYHRRAIHAACRSSRYS
jgi:hypothetical protein